MKINPNNFTLSAMILCCSLAFPTHGNAQTAPQDAHIAALVPWTAKGSVDLVDVPAAGNALSNMMMVAAIKAGSGSDAVDRIVALLCRGSNPVVAVMGQKQSVTEATVFAALQALAKLVEKSGSDATNAERSATLVLLGKPEDEKALQDAATAAAIRLEIAPIP